MVTPFINSVLFKFGLESNWCYKPVKPISQKEQAEIDEKHVKTLATYVDLLEKAKDMGNDDLYLKIQSDMNEYLQI
ncbi:hypothetical protein [Borreliella garinii]|nr:hypothetical protein [Borreliella garinii]